MPAISTNAREIFLSALDQLVPRERAAFVAQACEGNIVLQRHVEELLRAHEGPDSLLDQPRINLQASDNSGDDAPATIDHPSKQVGKLIGPYKLLEQIGEGGMGLVYMAEQQRPVRRLVALKIIKPGMDSKQVIARFEAERQALAMMDHSNIARVLDVGTTEAGLPFFVMELVRGIPINTFCDQKRLTVRERLELMIQVCQAVQHAHQKGIIHRDIKPTNVLVTQNDTLAVPKVIDFGIAKALGQQLTDHTLHTGFAQLVGTPLYMSPEQAEMNQLGVDTRSDVYSLGVLLYELLTGTTPFDKETLTKAGLDEMRRIIREDEPPFPSARVSTLEAQDLSTVSAHRNTDTRRISITLRGELDWIVMKALAKDRSERYESVNALAADVQRYLNDDPVLACPPSTFYRLQKFARRHHGSLATALTVGLALLVGAAAATWQAIQATTANRLASERLVEVEEQRVRAQLHLEQAIQSAKLADERLAEVERERMLAEKNFEAALLGVDQLLDQVRAKKGALPLPEATRRQLLSNALKLYDQLVAQSGDSLKARQWAAKTSSNVARQWQDLGESEDAHQAFTRAVELYDRIAAAEPSVENRFNQIVAITNIARYHFRAIKNFDQEAELFRRALSLWKELLNESLAPSQRDQYEFEQFIDMNGLQLALSAGGKRDEAFAINEQVLALTAGRVAYKARLNALGVKAKALSSTLPEEAEALHRQRLAEGRLWFEQSASSELRQDEFALILAGVGIGLAHRSPEEARELNSEALAIRKQLAQDYPAKTNYATQYITLLDRQAALLRRLADEAASQSADTKSVAFDLPVRQGLEETEKSHSAATRAEAEALQNEAVALRSQLTASDPRNPNRHAVIDVIAAEARNLRRAAAKIALLEPEKAVEQFVTADRQFRQALSALRERVKASKEPSHRERLIALLREQALFLLDQSAKPGSKTNLSSPASQRAEAASLLQEAIAISQELAKTEPNPLARPRSTAASLCDLARCGIPQAGKKAEADLRMLCQNHPKDLQLRDTLCQLLISLGKPESALPEFQPLLDARAMIDDQERAKYYAKRAAVWTSLGKLDNALDDFQQASALDAGNQKYLANRANLYIEKRQYAEAIADYTELLNKKRTKEMLRARAKASFYAGKFDDALQDIVDAAEYPGWQLLLDVPTRDILSCPDSAFRTEFLKLLDKLAERKDLGVGPVYQRAIIRFSSGQMDAALSDCSLGLTILPLHTMLSVTRGHIYRDKRQYDLAEIDYTSILNRLEMPWVNRHRAFVRFKQGNYDGSLADLEIAFRGQPDDYQEVLFWPLATSVTAPPAFRAQLRAYLERAAAAHQPDPGLPLNRAKALAELGQPEDLFQELAKVLAADGGKFNCHHHFLSAMLALRHGNRELYEKFCHLALQKSADSKELTESYYAAWACCLVPNAVSDYTIPLARARLPLETMPADRQYLVGLGAVLFRAGQFQEALEKLQAADAAEASPKTSSAYIAYFLAMTHQALGQHELARQCFHRANQEAEPELADELTWPRYTTLQLLKSEASQLIQDP